MIRFFFFCFVSLNELLLRFGSHLKAPQNFMYSNRRVRLYYIKETIPKSVIYVQISV